MNDRWTFETRIADRVVVPETFITWKVNLGKKLTITWPLFVDDNDSMMKMAGDHLKGKIDNSISILRIRDVAGDELGKLFLYGVRITELNFGELDWCTLSYIDVDITMSYAFLEYISIDTTHNTHLT